MEDHVGGLSCTTKMTLPLMITPEVWLRHGYCLSDIKRTLDSFPAQCITQLALIMGIPVSNKQMKIDFTSDLSRTFNAKANHTNKIMQTLTEKKIFPTEPSILDTERLQHVPPLPLHRIENECYQMLKTQWLQSSHVKELDFLQPNYTSRIHHWRQVQWIPIGLENEALLMHRVISWDMFIATGRLHKTMVHKPPVFIIENVTYACLEEACFFVCG